MGKTGNQRVRRDMAGDYGNNYVTFGGSTFSARVTPT